MKYDSMGRFDGCLGVNPENMYTSFRKIMIEIPNDKCCLVEIKCRNIMRNINYTSTGKYLVHRTFDCRNIVILDPPVAGKSDDWHELKKPYFCQIKVSNYIYYMSEKIISIESHNPLDIFGVNDQNLEIVRGFFPKLKIISRDNFIKAIGEEKELEAFEKKFMLLIQHMDKFGHLTKTDIKQYMQDEDVPVNGPVNPHSDLLVHGKNGMLIRARTANQRQMVESINKSDLLFAIGPAGTGKTYTAVALAVRALKNKEIQRIILTRPAVEAGENLGFLPGDLKEKLDPYLQPLYDALKDMLPPQKLLAYIEDGTIEIAPLAFMRGRTLNNAFAILDEAQNTTPNQLKMFLTRMGTSAKFIVTGDITQIDLPKQQTSGLIHVQSILMGINGIDFVYLNQNDIIRHKLVVKIINAYGNEDTNQKR